MTSVTHTGQAKCDPNGSCEKQLVAEAGPQSRAAVFEQSCCAFLLQSCCHFCVLGCFRSLEMMVYSMCLAWRHGLSCSLREAVMWKRVLCYVNIDQKWTCGGSVQTPLQPVKDNCILRKKKPKPFRVLCGMSATTYLAKPALYITLILKGPPKCYSMWEKPTWMKTLVVCGLCEAGNQIAAWHWALWLPQGVFKQEKRKQGGAAVVWGPPSPEKQSIFKYSFQSSALHLICVLQK